MAHLPSSRTSTFDIIFRNCEPILENIYSCSSLYAIMIKKDSVNKWPTRYLKHSEQFTTTYSVSTIERFLKMYDLF